MNSYEIKIVERTYVSRSRGDTRHDFILIEVRLEITK